MAEHAENDEAPRAAGKMRFGSAERDFVTLGIATAAIVMLVGTGSSVVPQVVQAFAGYGIGPDQALVNALLLNVALVIFGWRRYRQLNQEVQDRRAAEQQARLLAQTDPLSGLLNRRGFGASLDQFERSAAENGKSLAVLMIDLDNFKRINDLNGHSTGDRVIIECGRRIAALLPPDALLARIGGDEFACAIQFEAERSEPIERIAADIIEGIARPIQTDGMSAHVTASIGITRADIFEGAGCNFTASSESSRLLDMADTAMYHAKRQGRNGYFWFEDAMAQEMRYRIEIEKGIRDGLVHDEFVPYYEQQIDLQTGELTGYEMLARWQSPRLGLVSPEVFIPIAEDIGVISELSEQLIAKALMDAGRWPDQLTISVNISPIQLRDPWFAQKLVKLMLEANFPPARLEVEITETYVHENIALAHSLITSLKNQGIRVSLDDFGTGYSSLAQLKRLPFDRIKIDKSFVMNMIADSDDEAIVGAIARLGEGLGMPVTAEGIESDAILTELRKLGEIKGQGYHYGRPCPASEVECELRARGMMPPEPEGAIQDQPPVSAAAQRASAAR